jgi:hypothetical protein
VSSPVNTYFFSFPEPTQIYRYLRTRQIVAVSIEIIFLLPFYLHIYLVVRKEILNMKYSETCQPALEKSGGQIRVFSVTDVQIY